MAAAEPLHGLATPGSPPAGGGKGHGGDEDQTRAQMNTLEAAGQTRTRFDDALYGIAMDSKKPKRYLGAI